MLENTEVFEGMLPILNALLEPPEMSTVQDSFNFLYKGANYLVLCMFVVYVYLCLCACVVVIISIWVISQNVSH